MYLAFYNPAGVGDVLMLAKAGNEIPRQNIGVDVRGSFVRLFDKKTHETIGFNILNVSDIIELNGQGQVKLNPEQVEELNAKLYGIGIEDRIEMDSKPKLVVGHVLESEDHPDSDHLKVTKTSVGDQVYQIVCGASNCEAGIKVVVALPGAVMPNGQVIRPGALRGVESDGMLCSGYELGLPGYEQGEGIIILDDNAKVGQTFKFEQ